MAALLSAFSVGVRPAQAETTFTVNSTDDYRDFFPDDNLCDFTPFVAGEQCTLRAAIEQANAAAGADTINFAIPGTGVKTIVVNSEGLGALPSITDRVTIDGYTQTGASANTRVVGNDASLRVELTQTGLQDEVGIDLFDPDSSGSVIKGLVINRFGTGIAIRFCECVGNRIQGNFIGTNPAGTLDEGNSSTGVIVVGDTGSTNPSKNLIGGTTPAARNVISGNDDFGVSFGSGTQANLIKGNYIGTNKSGTKSLGNSRIGIQVAANILPIPGALPAGNTVGGTTAAARNVISGNHGDGIGISNSAETRVLGNRIGTTADGKGALGNEEDGVSGAVFHILIGNGTAGGSNTVAFNGDDGVDVIGDGSSGTEISRNSVFANAGLGIDLADDGLTSNDSGDADPGSNDLQNKPVITSARTISGKTTIAAKLDSVGDETYTIEFYANPRDTNEGKTFIGEKSVITSVDGLRTFTFVPATAVSAGQTITATASRSSTHDTSEFSAPRTVAAS